MQAAGALADGFRTLSAQLTTIQSQTAANVISTLDEVNSIGRQVLDLNVQIANSTRSATRRTTCSTSATCWSTGWRSSATSRPRSARNGAIDVTFARRDARDRLDLVRDARRERPHEPLLRQARRPRQPPRHAASRLQEPARRDRERDRREDEQPPPHGLRPERHRRRRLLRASGTTAATIAVDPAIVAAPGKIAAAKAPGEYGDATVALAIGDLRGDNSIDVAYRQLVTTIGADSQEAQRSLANATLLADALSSRRDSISGVSLDEEMTNLMKFQRGFQASSRALNAMDEMIDLLVNRTGRVGL